MASSLVSYREQALETIARNIIKRYDPTLLSSTPRAIPIEEIIEVVFGLKVEFQYIRNNGRILGETIFEDTLVAIYDKEDHAGYTFIQVKRGTIIVDASLINNRGDGRLRFTFAHELAHWIIHNDYFSNLGQNAKMKKNVSKSSDADKLIERQADILAGYLLMPTGPVKIAFNRLRGQTANSVSLLAKQFDVSNKALEIRLRSCGLI